MTVNTFLLLRHTPQSHVDNTHVPTFTMGPTSIGVNIEAKRFFPVVLPSLVGQHAAEYTIHVLYTYLSRCADQTRVGDTRVCHIGGALSEQNV